MKTQVQHGFEQQRDRVPAGPVYGFAAFIVILLLSGWAVAWIAERGTPMRIGRRVAPVEVMPREIESIDQTLFSAHLPSNGDWAAKRRALNSYQWVDATRGLATIPVDRAMQILVERGRVE